MDFRFMEITDTSLADARDMRLNEPRHDKTNRMAVRPAKTQISLDIRPVWSVFAVRSMGS